MCVNMAARLSAIGAGWSVVVLTAACAGGTRHQHTEPQRRLLDPGSESPCVRR